MEYFSNLSFWGLCKLTVVCCLVSSVVSGSLSYCVVLWKRRQRRLGKRP
jgi:hypothetical protein